jgi:hypothetical protein
MFDDSDAKDLSQQDELLSSTTRTSSGLARNDVTRRKDADMS